LCLYCHDNEHQKFEERIAAIAAGRDPDANDTGASQSKASSTTHRPFDGLADLLKKD
jgi:hypothetical protein